MHVSNDYDKEIQQYLDMYYTREMQAMFKWQPVNETPIVYEWAFMIGEYKHRYTLWKKVRPGGMGRIRPNIWHNGNQLML